MDLDPRPSPRRLSNWWTFHLSEFEKRCHQGAAPAVTQILGVSSRGARRREHWITRNATQMVLADLLDSPSVLIDTSQGATAITVTAAEWVDALMNHFSVNEQIENATGFRLRRTEDVRRVVIAVVESVLKDLATHGALLVDGQYRDLSDSRWIRFEQSANDTAVTMTLTSPPTELPSRPSWSWRLGTKRVF